MALLVTRAALLAASVVVLALPPGAFAEESAGGPGLSSAIPSDPAFFLHARLDDASRRRMEPLWEAFAKAGFLEDVRSRLLERTTDEKHRKWLEKEAFQWIALLEKVEWRKLFAREALLAARAGETRRQWIALFRVDRAERDGIVRSLERVLYALGSASPEMELIHAERENESVTALYKRTVEPLEDVAGVPPFVLRGLDAILSDGRDISVASKGDVVLLATSGNLLHRSLQLLDGKGSDLGFAYTERRRSRLEAAKLEAPGGPGFEMHADPAALFPEIEALGALGACVAAGKLEGSKLEYGFHAALATETKGDAETLRKALAEIPPLGSLLDRIPADATGFYAASVPRIGVLLDALEADTLIEDERTRRDFQELSFLGFLARIGETWLGVAEGFSVPGGPGARHVDALLGLVAPGATASGTTGSGSPGLEVKDKGGRTRAYVGWRDGRLAVSTSAKEAVAAALEGSSGGSPPALMKKLELPSTAVEAFDLDRPPRLIQLYLALSRVRIALQKTYRDPAVGAFLEASGKLAATLDKESPVSRARGFTARDGEAFTGRGTVTFRD